MNGKNHDNKFSAGFDSYEYEKRLKEISNRLYRDNKTVHAKFMQTLPHKIKARWGETF